VLPNVVFVIFLSSQLFSFDVDDMKKKKRSKEENQKKELKREK